MKDVLMIDASRGSGLDHARRFAERDAKSFATTYFAAEAKQLNADGSALIFQDRRISACHQA